jgi:hypothetical protein
MVSASVAKLSVDIILLAVLCYLSKELSKADEFITLERKLDALCILLAIAFCSST